MIFLPDTRQHLTPELLPVGSLGLTFKHVGLAARWPARAARFLSLLGYEVGAPTYDPVQQATIAIARHPGGPPPIELICSEGDGSPVDRWLGERDERICHFAYETLSTSDTLQRLESHGMPACTVTPPHPAPAFGGRQVSLHEIAGFGLVELIERSAPTEDSSHA